ncbi:hypothetical protein N665_0201s0465 [Sinapis alba]|nr:hypothetical protein N665_0201s0465 [Sinapis alba]
MASPSSDPTDAEPEAPPPNPIPTQKPTLVNSLTVSAENENSLTIAQNLESSTHEEPDATDQQPEASIEESKNDEDDMDTTTQPVTSSVYRRGGGPKRKKGNLKKRKQQEKSREKLEVLLKTLKPVPFVPSKALDFSRHEKLLKMIGIWEFLHLEFDQSIRQDLVASLVAYYSPEGRCSYVNGVRVKVSRADLARALKLPKKVNGVFTKEEREVLEMDESARFVDEIVQSWVLLQSDDMWVMPVEVFEWGRDIKLKQFEKLDWAGLLWFMVEKELKADPPLGECFFASHMQLLIRSQKDDLLREEPKVDEEEEEDVKEVEVSVKSPKEDCLEVKEEEEDVKEVDLSVKSPKEDCLEVKEEEEDVKEVDLSVKSPKQDCFLEVKEEEEDVKEVDLSVKSPKQDCLEVKEEEEDVKEVDLSVKSPKENCLEVKEEDVGAADSGMDGFAADSKEEDNHVEEHMIELNLGQETMGEMVSEEEQGLVEEQTMEVEEDKKEEDEKWSWNEDTHAGSFLRRCDLGSGREGDEENRIEEEEEEPMEMGEDEPIEDLEEDETEEDKEKHEEGFPFFPNGDSLHGVGQENLMLGDASPLRYGSGLQIHGGHFLASRVDMHMSMGAGSSFGNGNNKRVTDHHENDLSYHPHNPNSKRLRTEEPSWDEKPAPVEMCMDQLMVWVEKLRMSCAEKERERGQYVTNQEYLMSELQRKDEMIQVLERAKYEEQQIKDLMIYRLESELRMMTSVLQGYRKALKETKKASREHRKRCPLRDEKPVYKDVKGSGGLVLSTNEIEKMRLKQEVEDKMTRARIERQTEEFGSECIKEFQGYMDAVELLNERLIEVENEVNICRETLSESKVHDTSDVAAATAAATEET